MGYAENLGSRTVFLPSAGPSGRTASARALARRAGSLGRLRLLGPQASPCAMRGKRLLIIGYPKNRNYDVLDDGRPDIFIGHFQEAPMCPHASRACQKINRGPTSMYDIGLRLIYPKALN